MDQIVSFGKYKGQPLVNLLADTKYVEWCKSQPELLQKFPFLNTIIVNTYNPNANSKTPAHNLIQNMFLLDDVKNKMFCVLQNIPTDTKITDLVCDVQFEENYWDVVLCYDDSYTKFNGESKNEAYQSIVYCEIKPLLGDDYPCVLRKMKAQIKQIDELDPYVFLIIKEFCSSTTSKEQLEKIFLTAGIRICFTSQIDSNQQPTEKISMDKLIEENERLKSLLGLFMEE